MTILNGNSASADIVLQHDENEVCDNLETLKSSKVTVFRQGSLIDNSERQNW